MIYEDIRECKRLGASGVVVGALTKDGSIDVAATAEMIAIARPVSLPLVEKASCKQRALTYAYSPAPATV